MDGILLGRQVDQDSAAADINKESTGRGSPEGAARPCGVCSADGGTNKKQGATLPQAASIIAEGPDGQVDRSTGRPASPCGIAQRGQ